MNFKNISQWNVCYKTFLKIALESKKVDLNFWFESYLVKTGVLDKSVEANFGLLNKNTDLSRQT